MGQTSYIEIYRNTGLNIAQTDTILFGGPSSSTGKFIFENQLQLDYFASKRVFKLTALQYTRVGNNQVKVNLGTTQSATRQSEQLRTCDYMMIKPDSDEITLHRIYAFIVSVEYISDTCSLITFQVDPFQTFQHSLHLGTQLVERCHSLTDGLGDNLEPEENIAVSEYNTVAKVPLLYKFNNLHRRSKLIGDMTVVVAVTAKDDNTAINGAFYGGYPNSADLYMTKNGIYSGCDFFGFERLEEMDLDNFMHYFAGKPEELIAIYMCPAECYSRPDGTGPSGERVVDNTASDIRDKYAEWKIKTDTPLRYPFFLRTQITADNLYTDAEQMIRVDDSSVVGDNYTPKNKKLLSYPYNYLQISTSSGQTMDLRYERFPVAEENGSPLASREREVLLEMTYNFMGSPSITVRPSNYKLASTMPIDHSGTDYAYVNANEDYAISLNSYPTCMWTSDAFLEWKAQDQNAALWKLITGELTGAVMMVGGALATAYTGGAAAGLGTASITAGAMQMVKTHATYTGEKIAAKDAADKVHGGTNGDNNEITHANKMFYLSRLSAIQDECLAIDDYFTRNGYAQNKILDADQMICARPEFSFVKLINARISGSMNQEYSNAISELFNRGIRLWQCYRSGNNIVCNIGDFTVDNAPVPLTP